MVARLQNDVDHARNGIRAILSGISVAENLDVINCGDRDRIDIDTRLSLLRSVRVDARRRVPPLAIDQHQQMVGAESMKGQNIRQGGRVRVE